MFNTQIFNIKLNFVFNLTLKDAFSITIDIFYLSNLNSSHLNLKFFINLIYFFNIFIDIYALTMFSFRTQKVCEISTKFQFHSKMIIVINKKQSALRTFRKMISNDEINKK